LVISVGEILNRLEGHQPEIDPRASPRRAEVALVLDGSAADHDPSIIFIQRSPSPDDPWSGQMAFPGGRREDSDLEAGDAARRETREEIGLELRPAQPVGRLGDLQGRHGGRSADLVISCFVYAVDTVPALKPNYEVSEIVQIPLSRLLDPDLRTSVRYEAAGDKMFPGIFLAQDDARVIWGLTYRFLMQFFSRLGHSLPPG
jgi:8-oxo-dGTP pyrophosphatase MutT (NUDIX family)